MIRYQKIFHECENHWGIPHFWIYIYIYLFIYFGQAVSMQNYETSSRIFTFVFVAIYESWVEVKLNI